VPEFAAQIIHWPTLAAFVAHLATVPRPSWCKGITNHNTYIPNEATWYGIPSVKSCMKTYIGKGWDAGPHLFVAAVAPNPAHLGIFQLTPLTHQGIHAGACNTDHLGIEHVGDFDARAPTYAQYQLLLDVNRAILKAWGLPASAVNVHNECMPGRTCPGRHLTGAQIRADLVLPKPLPVRRYRVKVPSYWLEDRRADAPIANQGHALLQAGDVIAIDDVTSGWCHAANGIGFTPIAALEAL
jgi:N-acetylmuramoyl-L-alanine amidase-like protein